MVIIPSMTLLIYSNESAYFPSEDLFYRVRHNKCILYEILYQWHLSDLYQVSSLACESKAYDLRQLDSRHKNS